ncbi:MAG: hypothetical protein M1814_001543 [Vezdaea aestivalis]|nr:MAG: hypothetical protein M1814_001543 [Vezdaea aestivalis]
MSEDDITLTTRGKIAIITLNLPHKLNALGQLGYYKLASLMREVDQRDDILITVLTGTGRFFSAGADVSAPLLPPSGPLSERYSHVLRTFVANNLDTTRAFYNHSKILVTALNGPAVGLSAALIAHSDFIYVAPGAYLLTPFTSLGLVAEGGASLAFVERLGIAKANEALIMSRRIGAAEMVAAGFANGLLEGGEGFLERVLKEVEERLGEHLNGESLLMVKELIRGPQRERMDRQNVKEVFGGLDRFMSGVPAEEFRKIKSGEKKHKL